MYHKLADGCLHQLVENGEKQIKVGSVTAAGQQVRKGYTCKVCAGVKWGAWTFEAAPAPRPRKSDAELAELQAALGW